MARMATTRGWAIGVVLFALVAGGVGGVYLWRESLATTTDTVIDAGVVGDAGRDARAGRGKGKSGKRSKGIGRPAPPRTAPNPAAPGGNGTDDSQDNGGDDDDDPVAFQPPFRGRGPAGPTYEAALASNRQEVTIGGKAEPDLTDAQLKAPMQSGAFVGECGAPDRMKVTVRVAVKMGRAAGVTVSTSPSDADIAGCIDRYVRTFSWPVNSKMDSFTTTY